MKSQTCTRLSFFALLGVALAGGQAPVASPVASSTTTSKPTSTPTPTPAPKQWTQVFFDDFNGTAGTLPSAQKWILQQGTSYPGGPPQWGTGEIETYTNKPANVALDGNSNLLITPLKDASNQWTSARMESVSSAFVAPAGGLMKVEASIKMPNVNGNNGLGYWPAFWVLGSGLRANYSAWPSVGEFDLLENVNGGSKVGSGMHCGTNPGGPCNEPNGLAIATGCGTSGECHGAFHTYTMIHNRTATPEFATLAVDGAVVFTVTATQIGEPYWSNAVHKGIYLVLNVAMGGSYPNAVAQQTTPTSNTISGQPMTVDYVGVWTM